jgi:hypothetical protein
MRAGVPFVSPLRSAATATTATAPPPASLPAIRPDVPIELDDEEPPLPDEARARLASETAAPTPPVEAGSAGRILNVRFGGASVERLVHAMEQFRALVRERPGETRVVVHVPAPGGGALPMELKQAVAYDADLLAEVRRRLGEGLVELTLG